MKINVGTSDRTIRIILGIVVLALGLIFKSWWGLIGIIPLATGFLRWCPLYLPFKFSSAKSTTE